MILGQRLIRTLCRICRTEAEPPPAKTLEAHGIDRDEAQSLVFFKGKGCPTCNTIGYRGRRAIFEAIPASPEVRSALERGRPADEVAAAAVESGMITIRERALGLVKSGVTSFDEFATTQAVADNGSWLLEGVGYRGAKRKQLVACRSSSSVG